AWSPCASACRCHAGARSAPRHRPGRTSDVTGEQGLRTLLTELDPHWLDGVDPALLAGGRESRLGRQVLLRCLAHAPVTALLAPAPVPVLDRVAAAWPRDRLEALQRN